MPALWFMLQFSEQKEGKGGDRDQEGREGGRGLGEQCEEKGDKEIPVEERE